MELADLQTLATIDATAIVDACFVVTDTDRLSGTDPNARSAAGTIVRYDLYGMVVFLFFIQHNSSKIYYDLYDRAAVSIGHNMQGISILFDIG